MLTNSFARDGIILNVAFDVDEPPNVWDNSVRLFDQAHTGADRSFTIVMMMNLLKLSARSCSYEIPATPGANYHIETYPYGGGDDVNTVVMIGMSPTYGGAEGTNAPYFGPGIPGFNQGEGTNISA